MMNKHRVVKLLSIVVLPTMALVAHITGHQVVGDIAAFSAALPSMIEKLRQNHRKDDRRIE
jgi:hypothetical protein